MKKILDFVSPREHYTADACIVWCFDDRFSPLLERFTEQQKLTRIDLVKVAGGAKDLAGDDETKKKYILDQISASIHLHHAPRVILMMHAECGAYGGASDSDFYIKELAKAKSTILGSRLGDVVIGSFFADFEGLSEI